MKNIIFIAPPAAGKGTQSDMLTKNFGYEHISTGDMLREEIKADTELGKSIKNIIDEGKLVSDDIIITLIRNKLSNIKGKPFILDGFPRTLNQAQNLDTILNENNIDNYEAIYLEIDEEVASKRILGRLTCSCGKSYNIYDETFKPKVEGICDNCGAALIKRDDDNAESFKVRFQAFLDNNEPIMDYYRAKNKLNIVDVNTDSNTIYQSILEIVND